MTANVHPVFDTGYFRQYISLVNDNDILGYLKSQCESSHAFFNGIDEEKSLYRYADGKWSIREIAGHLCDSERIFAYRALRYARKDSTVLSPFDENAFVDNAEFDKRTLKDLAEELKLIRESNLLLFRSMNEDVLERSGTAGVATLSVRQLLYTIAGHQQHHINIINERYLNK